MAPDWTTANCGAGAIALELVAGVAAGALTVGAGAFTVGVVLVGVVVGL